MKLNLLPIPVRFCPSKETLQVLNDRRWICTFSGGKDSTSLVTWIEWLRRAGIVTAKTPRLVMSDTTVEYPFLQSTAHATIAALTTSGWQCEIVTPRISDRLYNRIFGIGNTPVHPGGRKMRWCTRATKIDPMKRFSRTISDDIVQLSGVRWGESDSRDAKLSIGGCQAGGECGLPEPGEGVYGPIIAWKTCKVIEWLDGEAGSEVNALIPDFLPIMKRLVGVYEVKRGQPGAWGTPPKISAMRFGCIGCPAITKEKITNSKEGRRHPEWVHLKRIHQIWFELYRRRNRCVKIRGSEIGPNQTAAPNGLAAVGFGPIKMAARKRYFAELMQVQKDSGVILIKPEDEAFIRDCWDRKVYPRGWSETDELTEEPETGLFAKRE